MSRRTYITYSAFCSPRTISFQPRPFITFINDSQSPFQQLTFQAYQGLFKIAEMAPAFQPRDRDGDSHPDSSNSEQDQQRINGGSTLPTARSNLPPSHLRSRRPVIFIIGPDSGSDSGSDLREDLNRGSDSNASSLIKIIRDSLPSSRPRAGSNTVSDRPKQLTRQFLGRRLSEGGGDCIKESWQQLIAEDLLNIHFRHRFGLLPNATGPFDGAWNGIDADFRESIDDPFLTRAQWLRQQLVWPSRSGAGSSPSLGGTLGSAFWAGPREDDAWVWCNTLPETFHDAEWAEDSVRDEGSEDDDVVEEQSIAEIARDLFIQAIRRLRADLARSVSILAGVFSI
jgi:hypothetical protein